MPTPLQSPAAPANQFQSVDRAPANQFQTPAQPIKAPPPAVQPIKQAAVTAPTVIPSLIPKAQAAEPVVPPAIVKPQAAQTGSPIIPKDRFTQMRQTMDDSVLMHTIYNSDPSFKAKVDMMKPFYEKQTPDWQKRFPTLALNKYYKINPDLPDDTTTLLLNGMSKQQDAWFNNADYGSGTMNPLKQAVGFTGNAVSDATSSLNPVPLMKGIADTTFGGGIGKLAGHALFKASDTMFGTHVEQDLNKIVDDNPNDHSLFGNLLRSIVKGDQYTQPILNTLKTYGIDKNGVAIADPNDPNKPTMAKGFFEHPLLPALIFGGMLKASPADAEVNSAIDNAGSAVKDKVMGVDGEQGLIDKIPGVDKAKGYFQDRNAKIEANDAYLKEATKPKTVEDLSVPARSRANDLEAIKGKTAIVEDGKVIGYKPNDSISDTLKSVIDDKPIITDPNNIPQTISEIRDARSKIMDAAEEDLTSPASGKIKEFFTKRYQDNAVKEFRSVLSDAIESKDNKISLLGDGDMPQKVATELENQFAERLKQSGEKGMSKMRLRQFIDDQLPEKSYGQKLSELTPTNRALMIFRRALGPSIEADAKAFGGKYGEYMKNASNLFKAEDTVSSHLPKPESLEERFTVPEKQAGPNKVPPSAKEIVTKGAMKVGKRFIFGSELGAGAKAATDLLGH